MNSGPTPHHLEEGEKLFLIWYADLDRETEKKKNPDEGFVGLSPKLVNDISGEILSLQSLSERQRELEKDLVRQIGEQTSKVERLSVYVTVLVGLNVALFTGGLLLALQQWMPTGTP